VAAGPEPAATLDRLAALDRPLYAVRGNADRGLVAAYDAGPSVAPGGDDVGAASSAWAASRVSQTHRDRLAAYPLAVELDVAGLGSVLVCHAVPADDERIVTSLTPAAVLCRELAAVTAGTVVVGHTHVAYDRRVGRWRLVNAGSVGMAYEGEQVACWALLGPDVELRRTPYDATLTAARIEATGYGEADPWMVENIVTPPPRAETERFFEDQAIARGERG
jgi:predicted phosphodiesterase